ncbi:Uncharacterised protein [Klebsiella pneumoniae]|nr:Uncharacterised protein [Klebsiella pneumoniae]
MESINNQVQSYASCWPFPTGHPKLSATLPLGSKNISDLFTDLATHQDKSAYRLGLGGVSSAHR